MILYKNVKYTKNMIMYFSKNHILSFLKILKF